MVISVFGWVVPFAIVVAIVYLVARSRQNQGTTWHQTLVSYFYLIIAACVITAAVGAVLFLTILFDFAFNDISDNSDMLIIASVLAGTGLIIGALHVEGRRILQKKTGTPTAGVRRFYLLSMLTLSGIAGLVSIPIAIYQIITYYALDNPYLYPRDFPSAALAAAIVIVLLWAYYLFRVLQEPRPQENGGAPHSSATSTAEA